jgi:hypothetical protein
MKSHTYSPLNHRPARPGITPQRSQITGYLAGAVGTAALLGTPQAEAAVTAVTFGFGTTYNTSSGYNSGWTVGPGFGSIRGSANTGGVVSLGLNSSLGAVYTNGSFFGAGGLVSFFADGTIIGGGGNGILGEAFFEFSGFPAADLVSDQLNKNIAFKTSTNNWGWANVSWTEANKTLTVHSAFVETTANTPITITAVPEPSRALLALAGLGGVALRRRRKQAA